MKTDALTDLIGGVILIPSIFVLLKMKTQKKNEQTAWIRFFAFLAASNVTGWFVHFVLEGWNAVAFRIAWILLHPLLVCTVDAFVLLSHSLCKTTCAKRCLAAGSALSVVVSVALLWIFPNDSYDIFAFLLFALLFVGAGFVRLAKCALRAKTVGVKTLFLTLLPLAFALYFQLDRSVNVFFLVPWNANAITHLFVIASECILFASAYLYLKPPSDAL